MNIFMYFKEDEPEHMKEEEQMAMASRLMQIRYSLSYTEGAMAEKLRVSCERYRKLEQGKEGLTRKDYMQALRRAYEINS